MYINFYCLETPFECIKLVQFAFNNKRKWGCSITERRAFTWPQVTIIVNKELEMMGCSAAAWGVDKTTPRRLLGGIRKPSDI